MRMIDSMDLRKTAAAVAVRAGGRMRPAVLQVIVFPFREGSRQE